MSDTKKATTMREALELCKDRLLAAKILGIGKRVAINEMLNAVMSALDAPPRNCERFKTKEEAALAFANEKKQWVPQQVLWELAPWLDWLFATAKEGENK